MIKESFTLGILMGLSLSKHDNALRMYVSPLKMFFLWNAWKNNGKDINDSLNSTW